MTAQAALEQAIALLRRDRLAAYVQVEDALAGLVVECAAGTEVFTVHGKAGLPIISGLAEQATARVRTCAKTIVALIDGEVSVLEAVKAGQLDMVASTPVLLRLAQAQRAFAEGAARARDMQLVLDEFRASGSKLA